MPKPLESIVRFFSYARSYSSERWRYLFYTLSRREKARIAILLFIAAGASLALAGYDYWVLRSPAPDYGGSYTEGVVGSPRYINPVLSSTNEADRDITELVFAGLTKHAADGSIVGDLAESFSTDENGRVYEFVLRDNLIWPDGESLTSEDVLFTINLVQNPAYQSPLRSVWQGVRAEAPDQQTVLLTLSVPYAPFLENTTLGILPQHHWETIQPQNFALAELNIKPVGSGPYRVHKITKDGTGVIRSIELKRNEAFYQPAYLETLKLRFYPSQDELVDAFKDGAVDGMSLLSPQLEDNIAGKSDTTHSLRMPRYFAIFFNESQNSALASLKLRSALAHATPKQRIIDEVLKGEARVQHGPFPDWLLPEDINFARYSFDIERSRMLLADAGWDYPEPEEDGTQSTARTNADGEPLVITLTTTDWPELTQVASLLQQVWQDVGVEVRLDITPIQNMQSQVIRPRKYEALLFGEVLSTLPDPFSFWHSSQTEDPGLNLVNYENSRVDTLLEAARQSRSATERQGFFREIQQIITRELPAIFLYNPNYLYILPDRVQGFKKQSIGAPHERFEGAPTWYTKTKRVR